MRMMSSTVRVRLDPPVEVDGQLVRWADVSVWQGRPEVYRHGVSPRRKDGEWSQVTRHGHERLPEALEAQVYQGALDLLGERVQGLTEVMGVIRGALA